MKKLLLLSLISTVYFSALTSAGLTYEQYCEALAINPQEVENSLRSERQPTFESAFRQFSLQNHPDKKPENAERFQEITQYNDRFKAWGFTRYTDAEKMKISDRILEIMGLLAAGKGLITVWSAANSLKLLSTIFKNIYYLEAASFIMVRYPDIKHILSQASSDQEAKAQLFYYINQTFKMYKQSVFTSLMRSLYLGTVSYVPQLLDILSDGFTIDTQPKPKERLSDPLEFRYTPIFSFKENQVLLIIDAVRQILLNSIFIDYAHRQIGSFLADFIIEYEEEIEQLMQEHANFNKIFEYDEKMKALLNKKPFLSWKPYMIAFFAKLVARATVAF